MPGDKVTNCHRLLCTAEGPAGGFNEPIGGNSAARESFGPSAGGHRGGGAQCPSEVSAVLQTVETLRCSSAGSKLCWTCPGNCDGYLGISVAGSTVALLRRRNGCHEHEYAVQANLHRGIHVAPEEGENRPEQSSGHSDRAPGPRRHRPDPNRQNGRFRGGGECEAKESVHAAIFRARRVHGGVDDGGRAGDTKRGDNRLSPIEV